jgi:transcriptional regulator with XRE-family HTH domain
MELNKLTDEDVAKGIDRTRVTVNRIRHRRVRPDWETIEKIKEFTKGAVIADDFQEVVRLRPRKKKIAEAS